MICVLYCCTLEICVLQDGLQINEVLLNENEFKRFEKYSD